jgi:hypothetical protein
LLPKTTNLHSTPRLTHPQRPLETTWGVQEPVRNKGVRIGSTVLSRISCDLTGLISACVPAAELEIYLNKLTSI